MRRILSIWSRIVCNNENVKFQGWRTGLQTILRLSIPFPWLSPMLPLIVCLFSRVATKNVFSNLWQPIVRKHAKNIHMWRIQSQIYFYCVSWFEKYNFTTKIWKVSWNLKKRFCQVVAKLKWLQNIRVHSRLKCSQRIWHKNAFSLENGSELNWTNINKILLWPKSQFQFAVTLAKAILKDKI